MSVDGQEEGGSVSLKAQAQLISQRVSRRGGGGVG